MSLSSKYSQNYDYLALFEALWLYKTLKTLLWSMKTTLTSVHQLFLKVSLQKEHQNVINAHQGVKIWI